MTKGKTAKSKQQKFGKAAFVESAENTQDSLLYQVVLEDGKSYTKEEVTKLVTAWKKKEVK